MEHKLTPLSRILSRHRDDLEDDDELQVGESPAELLKRLGLKNPHDLPAFHVSKPPLPDPRDNMALARWFVKFVRQNFLPRFLGGGFTQLEADAMLGDGHTSVDMSRVESRREMSRLRDRMTRLADRLDPIADEDKLNKERLEHLRARMAEMSGTRRGRHP